MRAIQILRIVPFVLFLTAAAAADDADFVRSDDPVAGAAIEVDEVRHGSLLLRAGEGGALVAAPSLETDASIRVTGLVARAMVRQRFSNPTDRWLEGIYVFPLPETAAVDGLKMVVGEQVIEGEIHEREAAAKVYTRAKNEGKKASLIVQERPNMFTTAVANIGPGEEIDVVIEYQQDVAYDAGRFSLRFPMVVAPRYVPGTPIAAGETSGTGHDGGFGAHGWAFATDQVPDAGRVTPPVAAPAGPPLNPVFLHLELDAGLPLADLDSPTHALHVEPGEGSRVVVELEDAVVPADRDFVLEWQPETGSAPQAALFTQEHAGELYTLLMVLPPHGDDAGAARLPRETVFVIDTSGSMQGESIRQARQALATALDHLRPEDHFNVVRFANASEKLFGSSVPASDQNLKQAKAYVSRLGANGGTEIRAALDAAFDDQERDLGLRQVIFVTDGSVANEDALFEHIRQNLGKSRLFTVGIGSAPNSYFMRRAAEEGRGTFTYVASVSEVGERMGELFDKLESPVLHDVEIAWDDPQAETWPEKVGDLYLGEPIQVAARLPNGLGGAAGVTVRGWRGGEYWERPFQLAGGAPESGIDKLWARKKIAALMASLAGGADRALVRAGVVELALAHHLVSKYTSLVAVAATPTAPAGTTPESSAVPASLPAGWSGGHANVAMPRGATPAPLALVLGALALGLAWLLFRGRP